MSPSNPSNPSESSTIITLPNTLRDWPWQRVISPYYQTAKAESEKWLQDFHVFSPKAQRAYDKCDFALVAAMTFPTASYYDMRSACDMMHAFFTLDEFTDFATTEEAKVVCDAAIEAVVNPEKPRPKGECPVGEIARQWWLRASVNAAPAAKARFVKTWCDYVDSVYTQASRRNKSYICTIDEYLEARRDNIASYPLFAFLEIVLEVDIPNEIMEHPSIVTLNLDVTDMLILSNDMFSYKKEVRNNEADYNMVTVVMVNNKTDVAGAIQWISDRHDEAVARFLAVQEDVLNKRNFPSFGEDLDEQLAMYIDGLGQWVRGHDDWSFASQRYFGEEGLEIQKTRKVDLC